VHSSGKTNSGKKGETSNSNLNRIRGKIVNKTNNGNGHRAMVDIGGMILHAAIPT